MKIKKLRIGKFGRFENKDLDLGAGLNIVYGENEKGKTTLHNFIEGIFYGFLKPNMKRTVYNNKHDIYQPWSSSSYMGSLEFEFEGSDYIIERNFKKGEEDIRILNASTGKNLTKLIREGENQKVSQPGNYFFGFNSIVYENTLSIGQLKSATERDLINEVRDRIANLSTSKAENISIEKSLEIIDKNLKDIGSERAFKSPYGLNIARLENLEDRKSKLEGSKEEYKKRVDEVRKLVEGIKTIEGKIANTTRELELSRLYEAYIEFERVKSIELELNSIKKEIEGLEVYKDFKLDDYKSLSDILKDIGNIEARLESIEIEKRRLGSIEKDKNNKTGFLDEAFLEDYLELKDIDHRKSYLEKELEDIDVEGLRNEENDLYNRYNHNAKLFPVAVLLFVVTILAKFILASNMILLVNIFTLPVILYLKIFENKTKVKLDLLGEEIEGLKEVKQGKLKELDRLEDRENYLFRKYSVTSLEDFIKKKDENKVLKNNSAEDLRSEILEGLDEEEINLKSSLFDCQTMEESILKENNISSIEDFTEALKKKEEYENLRTLEKSRAINYRELKERIGEFDFREIESLEDYSHIDSKLLESNIKIEEEEYSRLLMEERVLEEKLNNLNIDILELRQTEEEIDRILLEVKDMDYEKEVIGLTKDIILELSERIHEEFVPDLNESIGRTISTITGGKYGKVTVDEELNIKVWDREAQSLVELDNLSGGSIDQLYFSFRLGIINNISGQKFPLILDDCFIQYDDRRLKNILEFLLEESKDRQIILFTCQKREVEILKTLEGEYNLIEL